MLKLKNIGAHENEVHEGDNIVLFSYETPVACILNGSNVGLKTERKWSVTTSKHINAFFGRHGIDTINEKPQEFFEGLFD